MNIGNKTKNMLPQWRSVYEAFGEEAPPTLLCSPIEGIGLLWLKPPTFLGAAGAQKSEF